MAAGRKRSRHAADGWGLPAAWVPIVLLALAASPVKDLDGVEVFCGERALTFACCRAGLVVEGIDKEMHACMARAMVLRPLSGDLRRSPQTLLADTRARDVCWVLAGCLLDACWVLAGRLLGA